MHRHLGLCTLAERTLVRRPQRVLVTTRAWPSSPEACARRSTPRSLQLQHLTHELVITLALPADPSASDLQRWSRNIDVLHDVHGAAGAERVRNAVLANPSILAADLELWHTFLVAGFGLPPDSFAKLATDCPALLTHGDVFTAGCSMLFFKSMGWSNKDITGRIIGYYPQLLLLDRRRDIDPMVRFLERLDCRGDNLRLLVWEFPRIFDKGYRRHVRKFQHLGVYGLSLHGAAASCAAASRHGELDGGDGDGGDGSSSGGLQVGSVAAAAVAAGDGRRMAGVGGSPSAPDWS